MSTSPAALSTEIVDQLAQLPTISVDDDTFLALDAALDVVAALRFPSGIHDEADYEQLLAETLAHCAALGYASEVTLTPPQVPFRERGRYLKQWPPIDDGAIAAAVAQADAHQIVPLSTPQLAVREAWLLEAVEWRAWQIAAHQLSDPQREVVAQRCHAWLLAAGWRKAENITDERWHFSNEMAWLRDLEPNIDALFSAVQRSVAQGYTALRTIYKAGWQAAFNYSVQRDPEGIISDEQWAHCFATLGYRIDTSGEGIEPLPIELPDGTITALQRAIADLPRYRHGNSNGMLRLSELLDAFRNVVSRGQSSVLPDAQRDALLQRGIIGEALVALGFETGTTWYPGNQMQPPVSVDDRYIKRAQQIAEKGVEATFAEGLPVHAPVLVRDDERLVYLEMVGPKESVRANWAALRANYRRHYINRGWLSTNKSDGLTTLKRTLPCGWEHWALVHRQCAVESVQPAEPFYLLVDGESSVPPLFFTMLAHSLAVPLMPAWGDYLWRHGRLRGLIVSISDASHGMGGWRVEADEEAWRELVQEGLREGAIEMRAEPSPNGDEVL